MNRAARRAASKGRRNRVAAASALAVTGLLSTYAQILRAPSAYAAAVNPCTVSLTTDTDTAGTPVPGELRYCMRNLDVAGTGDYNLIDFEVSSVTLTQGTLPEFTESLFVEGGSGAGVTITAAPADGVVDKQIFRGYVGDGQTATFHNLTLTGGEAAWERNYGNDPMTVRGGAIAVSGRLDGYSASTITVDDVAITDSTAQARGGAIAVLAGDLNLIGSTLTDSSSSGSGGALYLERGAATIRDTTFEGNEAAGVGGAARLRGDTVTITDSVFTDNTSQNDGGALFLRGAPASVGSSTFTGNSSGNGQGGAIHFDGDSSSLDVDGTTFSGNHAAGDGGAIHASYAGSVEISQSTFTSNSAHDGGAVWSSTVALGGVSIDETAFSSNQASEDGGALWTGNQITTVTASTFADNGAAGTGGAIRALRFATYVYDPDTYSGTYEYIYPNQLTLTNVFIGGNSATSPGAGGIEATGGDVDVRFSSIVDNTYIGQPGLRVDGTEDNPATFTATGAVILETVGDTDACDMGGDVTVTDSYAVTRDESGSGCGVFAGTGSLVGQTTSQIQLGGVSTQVVNGVTQSFRKPATASVLVTDAPTSAVGTGVTADQIGVARTGTFTIGSIQVAATPPPTPGGGGSSGGTTPSVGAPGAPRNPIATPGEPGTVLVTWNPSDSDGGSAVTRYVVTAGPGGAWCAVNAPATSCTIAGLTGGQTYTFTVVAYNAASAGPGATTPPVTVRESGDPLAPLGPLTGGGAVAIPPRGLSAGGSVLLVNGMQSPVTVSPNRTPARRATGIVATGAGFTFHLVGHGGNGDPLGLTPSNVLILQSDPIAKRAKSQPVAQAWGSGFKPGTQVRLAILPTTELGSLTVDAKGEFSGRLPIPAGLTPGAHTVQANGYTADGQVRSLSIGVIVQRGATVATTKNAEATVFFAPLSATLTADAKSTLTKLVAKTGKNGVRNVVVGFVQPVGGTTNDQALSTARARSVATYLKSLGLRGTYVVRGSGRAPEGGSAARRVEVTVTYRTS